MGGAEAGPNRPEPEVGRPKAQHKKRKGEPTGGSPRKQEGKHRKRKAAEASPIEAKRRKRRESEATFKLERRYTAKRNEMASRNHTQHDRTQKRGKNSSLHNNNSSLNDTCPLPQLTRAKTKVYIITNSSYPHQEVPSDSLLLVPPFPPFPGNSC